MSIWPFSSRPMWFPPTRSPLNKREMKVSCLKMWNLIVIVSGWRASIRARPQLVAIEEERRGEKTPWGVWVCEGDVVFLNHRREEGIVIVWKWVGLKHVWLKSPVNMMNWCCCWFTALKGQLFNNMDQKCCFVLYEIIRRTDKYAMFNISTFLQINFSFVSSFPCSQPERITGEGIQAQNPGGRSGRRESHCFFSFLPLLLVLKDNS